MKFGIQLANSLVPEWAEFYIDYEGLKSLIIELRPVRITIPFSHSMYETFRCGTISRWVPCLPCLRKVTSPRRSVDTAESDDDGGDDHDHWSNAEGDSKRRFSAELFLPNSFSAMSTSLLTSSSVTASKISFASRARSARTEQESKSDSILLWENWSLESTWKNAVDKENDKVDDFYIKMEIGLERQLDLLIKSRSSSSDMLGQTAESDAMESQMQKLSKSQFVNIYRKLTKLVNFCALNYIGFSKVCKKFDKNTSLDTKDEIMSAVESSIWYSRGREERGKLQILLQRIVDFYANNYEHGDTVKAKIALLAKMTNIVPNSSTAFTWGVKTGIVVMLICWVMVNLYLDHLFVSTEDGLGPVYRGFGILILMIWFWGINVKTFHKYRINYVFIFEYDPRNRLTHTQIFEEACDISIVYLLNSLLFISHKRWFGADGEGILKSQIWPYGLLIYALMKVFSPFFTSHWNTRACLLETIKQILIAPLGRVRFRDFFVADIMTSLAKVFSDLGYTACYFFSPVWTQTTHVNNGCDNSSRFYAPILIALPYWFRLHQCLRQYYDHKKKWPYLANALKYFLAMTVTMISAVNPHFASDNISDISLYRGVWIFLIIVSTLYSFAWDVKMDWGLMEDYSKLRDGQKPGPRFLRSRLLYPHNWPYYYVIISDFFLRFAWVYQLIPTPVVTSKAGFTELTTFLIAAELFRRFQWGLFRVEKEHVSNAEHYRRYAYVPIDFDTYIGANDKKKSGFSLKSPSRTLIEVGIMVIFVVIVAVFSFLFQG